MSDKQARPPRNDLYRAVANGATTSDGRTLTVRLAPPGQWAEIDSASEGHFMERFASSAYRKTMAEHMPKILFQHGKDPQVGEKPISTTDEVGEDEFGPFARGQILDGVPPLVVDGLRKGVYGASHRFSVVREEWNDKPFGGPHNPDKIPERTVTEARLFELGPVTWPAYATASAALRSMTDEMRGLITPPEAPSVEAGAAPHLEPERREVTPSIQKPKENIPVEYTTRDDKASRASELKDALQRQAVEHPGVLPADAQIQWDADTAELRSLEADIDAWDKRTAFVQSLAENRSASGESRHVETTAPSVIFKKSTEDLYDLGEIRAKTRSRDEYDTQVKEHALRAVDSLKLPKGQSADMLADIVENRDMGEDGSGEIARRVLLTGSPAYRRAFNKYLKGQQALWSPEEARSAALAVTGTTTTGGYAVPYVFDPTMIHIGAYTAGNPFREACRVETITNGNNWRAVTVGNVAMAYATEAAAGSEGGPTFAQPTYTVQTATGFVTLSVEAMEDRPDITGELSSVLAEGKATLEENKFALGAGTTVYPQGMFLDGAYTAQTTATNDVTALLDFTVVEGALPLRFRQNAAWFMARSTIRQLQILDTTYRYFSGASIQFPGNNLLTRESSSGGNTGLQLLGYPIWEVPSAVSTLTTDAAIIAVLCDPKSYIIVDRVGMNIEVIPQMLNGATPSFPTLQRGIVAWFRNTARPHTADAGRQVKVQ